MKICCIDFETANSSRASACSAGVALIIDGKITHTEERKLKPHASCRYFDPFNVAIHGIRASDVAREPEFDVQADWLFEMLDADLVVAHNAAFDISVLRAVCDLYGMSYPEFDYFCTCKAAGRLWTNLYDHKLNTLCDHIGHRFNHHNAEADAEAAGKVLLRMLEESNSKTPHDMAGALGIKLGRLKASGYTPCSCGRVKR